MIDFIEGEVAYIESGSVVIETIHGVGYRVFCPNPYVLNIQERTRIYTHYHVREDANLLYGFASRDKRSLFRKMLDVTGIGPRGALAIMAAAEPHQIVNAVQQEDMAFLTKFPGVGKKTAARMVLELKDKLQEFAHLTDGEVSHNPPLQAGDKNENQDTGLVAVMEASEALKALGYSDAEIQKVMSKLRGENDSTEILIKKALRQFSSS